MKIKQLTIIAALSIVCAGSSCFFIESMDFKLLIHNNSSSSVIYSLRFDTSIAAKDIRFYTSESRRYNQLLAHDSIYPAFARRGEGWESKINAYSKDSTLRIFFFKTDSVEKYGWDRVLLLKTYRRLNLRPSDLDRLHWKITYS